MSHITTVKAEFRDLDSIAKACEAIGWKLIRNQREFKTHYLSLENDCNHVIQPTYQEGSNRNIYGEQIGLRKNIDGTFSIVLDKMMFGTDKNWIDGPINSLKQEYAAAVATKAARAKGYRVYRQNKNGKIKLTVSGFA